MDFIKIQEGSSLLVTSHTFHLLKAIGNNSSRLSDQRINSAGVPRKDINLLVELLRDLPWETYSQVQITATDSEHKRKENGTVKERTLRVTVPPRVANTWLLVALETISALGDPEAEIVTGYATTQLEAAAVSLEAGNWRLPAA